MLHTYNNIVQLEFNAQAVTFDAAELVTLFASSSFDNLNIKYIPLTFFYTALILRGEYV